jgi:hypothetical protein
LACYHPFSATAEELTLWTGWSAGPADGVQRLVEKLGAGSLPAVTFLDLNTMHVGNTGASALAAALGRGALPRLMILWLSEATIGDAGLVAPRAGLAAAARAGATQPLLQPARRRGPRRPRGATAAAGRCAAAAGWRADEAQAAQPRPHQDHRRRLRHPRPAALDGDALPALADLNLFGIPAFGDASKAAVDEALERTTSRRPPLVLHTD